MRSTWLAVFLSAATALPGLGQTDAGTAEGNVATGSFVASQTEGLSSTIRGSYTIDSVEVRVRVDSAQFWLAAGREAWLGGLAVGLGRQRANGWDIERRSPYLVLNRGVREPDTLMVRGLELVVPRSDIDDLAAHWLVFSLALGSLEGRADLPPLAFWYAHSPRGLFRNVAVPATGEHTERLDTPVTSEAKCVQSANVSSRFSGREYQVRFVIDTLGRPEPGSIELLNPAEERLPDVVVDYVRSCRLAPRKVDGRRVRMMSATVVRFR